ncbi:MAG TPA: antitoxin [Spirochaetota bacterium]|nr:antitoxin [Spirochaetota bacterium]
MMKKILEMEERELLDSVESGEWKSVKNLPAAKREARAIARNTLRKDARMNIRISSRDLAALRAKALAEGLPYQALVTSILHKYLSGALAERK